MTEKKNHTQEEEFEENRSEAVSTSEEVAQLSAEVGALKKKLAEAESKTFEFKDSWLRSQAEFQNYRKRIERDSELTYISLKGDILKKVLPVLDDLERALQNRSAEDAWANGIELVARKFQTFWRAKDSRELKRWAWSLIQTSTRRSHTNP